MVNDYLRFSCFSICLAMVLWLTGCSSSLADQEKMVLELAKRSNVEAINTKVMRTEGAKDPGIEWSLTRTGVNNFRSATDLTMADDYDRKFFVDELTKNNPTISVDASYYLLRGDIAFDESSLCKNACNVYVLESDVNSLTYGAIYSD